MAQESTPRFSGEWWKRKAVEATAVGAAALTLVGCAPGTSAEKPPAASPAVPGETPAPSEGNPVETPDNGEKDPLSPEALLAMTLKERLEAIRIPEGTSAEEWVKKSAEIEEKVLNAAISEELYKKYREKYPDGYVPFYEYALEEFLEPLVEQLYNSPVNHNKNNSYYIAMLKRSGTQWNVSMDQGMPNIPRPHITIKVSGIKAGADGKSATYDTTVYDTVDQTTIDAIEYCWGPEKASGYDIMDPETKWPSTVSGVHYNKKLETMQPDKQITDRKADTKTQ